MGKVLILTEAGKNIGFGHLTRCISLYQAFEEKGVLAKLVINGDETVRGLLEKKRYVLCDWLKDNAAFVEILQNADVVIVDSYLANEDIYRKISAATEIAVYFDDNKRILYPKGIIINGSVSAESMDYTYLKEADFLLGARYIPLRKEFWQAKDKPLKQDIEEILVIFGGDDSKGMTKKILDLLVARYPELHKNVIMGKFFKDTGNFKERADGNTKLIYYPNVEEIKEKMSESDITISAGGQTLHELARLGVPTIGVCVADNQERNLKASKERGFLKYAGWYNDKGLMDNIDMAIKEMMPLPIRQKMSDVAKAIVDGQGARRIVAYLINKYAYRY